MLQRRCRGALAASGALRRARREWQSSSQISSVRAAEAFIAAGMRVALGDIEAQALEETTGSLRGGGADGHPVLTDVSKPEQVENLARQTPRKYGAVHVLCNNAGKAHANAFATGRPDGSILPVKRSSIRSVAFRRLSH
jgi:NAD(P)-dependent dehydrogenase (short-subunit alcohol dehydrogenase family)